MKFNLGKFLVPILTAAIQGQLTSKTTGLSKREKVVKIALDSVTSLGSSGIMPEDRAAAIVADGRSVIEQANDLFVQATKLKQEADALIAQGRTLLDSLKEFGKTDDATDPLE